MAKKELVDVDEELLKGIMVGDVPVFGRKSKRDSASNAEVVSSPMAENEESAAKSKPEHQAGSAEEQPSEKGRKSTSKNARRTPEGVIGYREQFLMYAPSSSRAQTYINREAYDLVKRFLPVIAPDVSISSYISNILIDHLERYWSEIDRIYNEENSKPTNEISLLLLKGSGLEIKN